MEGSVSSFLTAKGYGFARGDDGRDYFLHKSDIDPAVGVVIEGQRIVFEESATPQGYRARRVRPVALTAATRYLVPEQVLESNASAVRGWEILETSPWKIRGTSRDSPDSAKADLLIKARCLGATGVVLVQYSKTTGSESGTGRGTHHYTIHHFRGHPVVLARLSTSGTANKSDLEGLGKRAAALKAELVAKSEASRTSAAITALVVVGAGLLAGAVMGAGEHGVPGLVPVAISLILAFIVYQTIATDHDSWLEAL